MNATKEDVIRISIGYFPPELTSKVESMLNNEFKNSLIPAIQKLKGNIGYFVAIDRERHAMTNVSFWETAEDANQMATLKEMLDMAAAFKNIGLKFIEITNHNMLWKLPCVNKIERRNAAYWVEIPVKDFARAKKFYETIFNIEMPLVPMSRGKYAIFPLDKNAFGAGAAIVEGKNYEPAQNGAIVYLDRGNEDLAIPLSKVPAAGGKIILNKIKNSDNEGSGFIAQFIDTEGNRIGLHSME